MIRSKLILTMVAAVALLVASAIPAMAQVVGYCDENGVCTYWNPDTGTYSPESWHDCGWVWDPGSQEWVWACW
jgi:hypothetical protein